MAKKLPVDFEKKVKQPPPADGKGYPYQMSAKDLMANFKFLLSLLPEGSSGDMLYHDGTEWVLLASPSASASAPVLLSHDGSLPSWGGGTAVTVVVVDNGEFKTGTFYVDGSLTSV